MPTPTYAITCTRKTLVAPDVYEFVFTKPEGFTFKPGQFVLFDVPHPDNPEDVQTRAYSIASLPDEDHLFFIIKLMNGGRASTWLDTVVTEGTSCVMKGPFGIFLLDEKNEKSYVFVATGTGIGPFRCQLRHLLQKKRDTRPIHLVFGVRTKADVFWADFFTQLERAHPNFRFHLSLTSGEPDHHGHAGRVQTLIPKIVDDFANVQLYVCGAPEMVKEVKTLCLEEWGMENKDVKVESYI